MNSQRETLLEKLEKRLSRGRIGHSLGVEACAVEMADHFGADRKKASIAGLMHDCAKELGYEQAKAIGEQMGIFADMWMLSEPALWHAPIGAYVAREEFGVTDAEILSAIECHTTGRAGMSVLDKIIYLADYIEPARSFEGVELLRVYARHDLNKALLTAYDITIRYLLQNNKTIHPQTILARNEAIIAEKQNIVKEGIF